MIDHLSLGSTRYADAVAFYLQALAPLGLTLLRDTGREAAFGTPERWGFFLYPVAEGERVTAPGAHLAFAAPSRAAVHTIADGIAVRVPVPEAVADMRGTVDEVVLVSEDAIERAMRLTFQHAGLVVEPAGVVGIAALLEHPGLRMGRAATVLCGSNLTAEQVARWLT